MTPSDLDEMTESGTSRFALAVVVQLKMQEISAIADVWPIAALSAVMQNPNVECSFLRRHPLAGKIMSV